MQKKCPKCQAEFRCQAEQIADCFCAEITLSDAARKQIAQAYQGCLCRTCLLEEAAAESTLRT